MKYFFFFALSVFSLHTSAQTADQWTTVQTINAPTERHENSFVESDGKFYLLGGRGIKPIDEYDPATNTWKTLAEAPIEFHHF